MSEQERTHDAHTPLYDEHCRRWSDPPAFDGEQWWVVPVESGAYARIDAPTGELVMRTDCIESLEDWR